MEQSRENGGQERCRNRSTPLPALRRLRREAGLGQRELAEKAGISPGTVYRLENGLRGAYPTTLLKLARALGVGPADLVLGDRPE